MLRAMAYGHSSGLPPSEAPVMIAEKRKLSFLIAMGDVGHKEGGKTTCYEALDLISQPAALITSGQLASTPDKADLQAVVYNARFLCI